MRTEGIKYRYGVHGDALPVFASRKRVFAKRHAVNKCEGTKALGRVAWPTLTSAAAAAVIQSHPIWAPSPVCVSASPTSHVFGDFAE